MKRTPIVTAPDPDTSLPIADETSRVMARPDGFYWVADDGRQEFGPFATAVQALAALREGIETALEPGETVAEAEAEIGIGGWVDPDTGQPAEDVATRLEEH
jgi:hypothetical protein